MPDTAAHNTAVVPAAEAGQRDVDTVPFVEMLNNRVQGVVSSGSDVARVYCAFIEAGTGHHSSSTNNNRPDAGTAKRLGWLLEEAARQYGLERVARYLEVPTDPATMKRASEILLALRTGQRKQEPAGTIFSRFLNYLRYVELKAEAGPLPEMSWFVAQQAYPPHGGQS
jgi:hypothetical protein